LLLRIILEKSKQFYRMQIDRSNYEVWLIDWLDGKLDEGQINSLQSFLKDNTDLRDEYEDFGIFQLKPAKDTFHHKNHLKKTAANLTESQFEYLCAAYLENDLLPDQISELNEAISGSPGKRRSFELIQKMKLIPEVVPFKGKRRLIKRTFSGEIIRLSVIGLSAAALVAIGLFIFNSGPADYTNEKTAQELKIQSPEVQHEASTGDEASIRNIGSAEKKNKQAVSGTAYAKNESVTDPQIEKDASAEKPVTTLNKVRVQPEIDLKKKAPNELIALNIEDFASKPYDERSKVSRFIAKTFREKILNENAPHDKPLKAVEIAEAGVTGLNKILGWEMALSEKSSADGKTEKIYFNSRILKINAPENKSEPGL